MEEISVASSITRIDQSLAANVTGEISVADIGAVNAAVKAAVADLQDAGRLDRVNVRLAGVTEQLAFEQLPILWAYGALFWGMFATIGIATSGSFDNTAPSMAITVSFIMANYIIEVIGSFWDVAEPYQYLSLFHHFVPADLLVGTNDLSAAAIFGAIALAASLWGIIVFPRRDLAAPN